MTRPPHLSSSEESPLLPASNQRVSPSQSASSARVLVHAVLTATESCTGAGGTATAAPNIFPVMASAASSSSSLHLLQQPLLQHHCT
ncbi:unnamed protein product [Lota lota]